MIVDFRHESTHAWQVLSLSSISGHTTPLCVSKIFKYYRYYHLSGFRRLGYSSSSDGCCNYQLQGPILRPHNSPDIVSKSFRAPKKPNPVGMLNLVSQCEVPYTLHGFAFFLSWLSLLWSICGFDSSVHTY